MDEVVRETLAASRAFSRQLVALRLGKLHVSRASGGILIHVTSPEQLALVAEQLGGIEVATILYGARSTLCYWSFGRFQIVVGGPTLELCETTSEMRPEMVLRLRSRHD